MNNRISIFLLLSESRLFVLTNIDPVNLKVICVILTSV